MKRKSIVGLITILAIAAAVIFAGCVEEEGEIAKPTGPAEKVTEERLTTKTPLEIALSIDDMPDGWVRYEKPYSDTSKTYERYFVTFSRELFGTDYLDCEVTKYYNVSDAKMAFESSRESYAEKIKTKSVGLGDESYGWNYGHESCVHFRKSNIIADLYFESQYGKPDIEHAKKFAEIVEKKIV